MTCNSLTGVGTRDKHVAPRGPGGRSGDAPVSTARDLRTAIVAAVDTPADSALWVVERACDEAIRRQPADVHALHAVEPRYSDAELAEASDALVALVRDRLAIFATSTTNAGWDWVVRTHVRRGDPAEAAADLAAQVDADLVCVGAAAREGSSTTARLLDEAGCPVLVVRPKEYGNPRARVARVSCPDCERTRAETGGEEWLCERHREQALPLSAVLAPHARFPLKPGGVR